MKIYIVTTTIQPPTEATIKYSQMEGWQLVVVGDKKTPHIEYENINCEYLHPDDQEDLNKELSDAIGWNCTQRRNLGFLYSYLKGADLMNQLRIKPLDIQRFDVKDNIFKQNIDLNNYQYRCKADNHYNYPRIIEANLLTIIHDLITNHKITKIKKFFYYFYFEILKIFYIREFIWKIYLTSKRILKLILCT
jgi:hypothetical protein